MKKYDVYYMRPEFFPDGGLGATHLYQRGKLPVAGELDRTHIFLKVEEAANREELFSKMQGENWSPNGEARSTLSSKGIMHTSMSVGDVLVEHDTNEVWLVDTFGFHKLVGTDAVAQTDTMANVFKDDDEDHELEGGDTRGTEAARAIDAILDAEDDDPDALRKLHEGPWPPRSTYGEDMRRGELSDDLGESPDY